MCVFEGICVCMYGVFVLCLLVCGWMCVRIYIVFFFITINVLYFIIWMFVCSFRLMLRGESGGKDGKGIINILKIHFYYIPGGLTFHLGSSYLSFLFLSCICYTHKVISFFSIICISLYHDFKWFIDLYKNV